MRGYDIGFIGKDRPFHEIQAQLLGTSVDSHDFSKVHVDGLLMVTDFSGTFDDAYQGIIDYTVVADV